MNDDEWDASPPNGSSIAFLASYDGRTMLLAADAHADVLAASLRRVSEGKAVRVDVCKVPHHASRANVKPEFLGLIDCSTWLISTNGNLHGHPDRRAMARILRRPRQVLIFNYSTETTKEYGQYSTRQTFDCTSHYPTNNRLGIGIDLSSESIAVQYLPAT